jgi:hypothetical protein
MLTTDIIERRPKSVQVQALDDGSIELRSAVRKTWWLLPKTVFTVLVGWVFGLLIAWIGDSSPTTRTLLMLVILILFLGGWTLLRAILLEDFGQVVLTITPTGFQQQLFLGKWRLMKSVAAQWASVNFMALVLSGWGNRQREIQIVRSNKPDLELKRYYNSEQITYLERCLQHSYQNYITDRPLGTDWSVHLVDD